MMSLFKPVYRTWLGGFLITCLMAGSWTVGPAYLLALVAAMAPRTYGFSLASFAVMFVESRRTRQGIAVACLSVCAICGPRTQPDMHFFVYWACFLQMAVAEYYMYFFGNLSRSPSFLKFVQDMGPDCYHYNGCELRGAVDDIQKNGSMFGFHPHGVLSIGMSWNGCWNKKFLDAAGLDTHFMIDKALREDNAFFKVICDLHGGVETLSKRNITKALAEKRNIGFIPGGFEDATLAQFGLSRVAISKRTGFIKYALEQGTRVHPIWTFGEDKTHYTVKGMLKFRLWLNKFGIPAAVFFGFPLLPILPRPASVPLTYVGEGIQFPKIDKPSRDDVAKWHKTYLDALLKLFNDNKKEAGLSETAKLEIW